MLFLALSLWIAAASSAPRPAPPQVSGPDFGSEEAVRRYAQGRLLEEQDKPTEALGEYLRALRLDGRSLATARRLSEISARLGDPHQSLEFADRSLSIDPADARALWLKGGALFNLGRANEALEALEHAVAADSNRLEYLGTLARVAEELDQHEVVARACRRAVAIDDSDGEAWFRLAAAEARIGRFDAARKALTEAIAENPDRPGASFLEGWIEEGLGNGSKAITLYRDHLEIQPRDDATRRRLVGLLAEAGRPKEAYREARVVTQAHPRDPDALAVEADLAFKAGQAGEASQVLERLAALAPDDPENVRQRVEVLARNKRMRDALTLAESWTGRHPDDYRGAMLSARAHFLNAEHDVALAEARRAVEMVPDSLSPRLLLGRLSQVAKRWAEAAEVWAEVQRREPNRPGVVLDLAYCRDQLGDVEGAERAARDALGLDPVDARALNFLGYLLADHNRKLAEAEDLIRKAVEQEPDNGAFVDSMGWVYFRLGRLTDARRELERAVLLTGGDAVVREHLGDVYKEMRLIDLAKEQYRLSLAGDRSNARVKTKLDGLR